MKIFHVITSLKIGGAESALYNLLKIFQKNNVDSHYVAYFYDGPNVEKIKKLGIPIFKIKGFLHHYDPIAYLRLKRLIKKINPNVIHSALWSANFLSRIIGNKLKIPIICDLHSNITHDGKLRIWLEKLTAHKASRYIAVSHIAHQGFTNSVVHKIKQPKKQNHLKSNLKIIQNGIDMESVQKQALQNKLSKTAMGFEKDDFIVGSIGRLEPIKSYDLLIKSFALFANEIQKEKNNIKLCLVGDGSQRKELEKLALTLRVADKVLFVGQRTDAQRFYPLFDCFVLSSLSEGLSISLLEALCFGLPIITTHPSNKHDVIKDGINGFLVPVQNKIMLARTLNRLYINQVLKEQMRTKNTALVKTKFEITQTKNAYQETYTKLTHFSKSLF